MIESLLPLGPALHAMGMALALILRRQPNACLWAAFLAELSTVETAPYFASEVRCRSEIGAPFERHRYEPALRAVLAAAGRLRIIRAGSLHSYLAYVLVLGVMLLWWLGRLP